MSVTNVPASVRYCLWGKAAGRCEYRGCNHALYRDDLTKAEFNTSYIAHIVADQPDGPRGDKVLSEKLKADISNLMLLCDAHHRLIDIADVAGHPVSLLEEMKSEHEARVELLTGIQDEMKSHVLLYGAKVGDNESPLTASKAMRAMVPNWYPAANQPFAIGMKSSFSDGESLFWEMEQENLRRQIDRLVKPAISSGDVEHLSVFGFAPIPLLIALGREISDICPAEVYQLHREPPTWNWQTRTPKFSYQVTSSSDTSRRKVALILSLSANILPDRIHSVLGDDIAIWSIHHSDPHNDFLRARSQLQEFRRVMRRTFNQIKVIHGESAQLHIFPAVPVSAAIEIGRVWQPKADLPFVVYDQNRNGGGFVPALSIQQPN